MICKHCSGTGERVLTSTEQETLEAIDRILRSGRKATSKLLSESMRITGQSACARLARLTYRGLLCRRVLYDVNSTSAFYDYTLTREGHLELCNLHGSGS